MGILLQPLRSVPCSLSFVEKFRMVMMAKSESNYTEIPNELPPSQVPLPNMEKAVGVFEEDEVS